MTTRILIYTHTFAPKIGGVETLVMSLARGLANFENDTGASQVKVTVATSSLREEFDDKSLPFRVVRRPSFWGLLQLIRGADVIHLAGPSFLPMLLGLIHGKPVVVEHSGYQACCPNGLLLDERTKTVCPGNFMARRYVECIRCNAGNVGRGRSLLMVLLSFPRRWMCERVARNIAPSAHVSKRLELRRTTTIYHGVAIARSARQSLNRAAPIWFISIGRLVWEKGLQVCLAAARDLAAQGYDFRLKIVGDGPERTRLEEMTDAYKLRSRTVFSGYLQGDALVQALEGNSVVVMPSVWEETAGLSVVEQMMHGRAVIATDIGGLGELVDEAGLKFPSGNVEALAACMKRVLDQPDLSAHLGERARQRALDLFLEEDMIAKHIDAYREAGISAGPTQ